MLSPDWHALIAIAGSRPKLARDLGTTEATLSRWINGNRTPNGTVIKCIEYYKKVRRITQPTERKDDD